MEPDWVLERTEIGQDEIARRSLRLPLSVRAVLLMVDGKSEVSELQRKMAGMAEGMNTLESLFNNGLIQKRSYSCDDDAAAARQALAQSRKATDDAIAAALAGLRKKAAAAGAPETSPATPKPSPKPTRRSLGLARMYMLDQMERMFGDKSDAARSLLRMATTREALLVAFNDCREVLLEIAGLDRTQRIEQEFYAMLPEASMAE